VFYIYARLKETAVFQFEKVYNKENE